MLAVPGASSLLATASLLATGTLAGMAYLGLAVAAVGLVHRRWFCRWICPVGTCSDVAGKLAMRAGRRSGRFPRLGPWLALFTLGGAVVGFPLLLWSDPLALFAAASGIRQVGALPELRWYATGIIVIVVLSALWPGIWCMRLCPLGAFHELLFQLGSSLRRAVLPGPSRAPVEHQGAIRRRALLAGVVGLLSALILRQSRGSEGVLRPPGAARADRFTELCVRCGNCLRACPVRIVRPALVRGELAAALCPTLDFSRDYCHEDCVRCTQVCPSGALNPVALPEKAGARIGLAVVDMNLCLLGDDRECFLCRSSCPYEALTYVFSESEYTLVPTVDTVRCSGCGACQAVCPTTPTKAIVVVPVVGGGAGVSVV